MRLPALSRTLLLILTVLNGQFSFAKDITSWQLVYSSDFHGELKPCGCSAEGNLGGILRRATKLAEIRKLHQNVIVVSAGDLLDKTDEQSLIKARYMLEGQSRLALDAILPGERDLNHPEKLLTKYRLPWVLTNNNSSLPFPVVRTGKISSGQRVLILGLLDPALLESDPGKNLSPPEVALNKTLSEIKATQDDIIILLLHGKPGFENSFSGNPLIDVMVLGHLDRPVTHKPASTKVPLLSAGHRGQRLGIATMQTSKPDQTTRLVYNEVITLPNSVPDHPELTHLYTQYNNEIAAWYRNKTARMKAISKTENPYATAETCKVCHIEIYQSWKKSRHSNALASLQKVKKDEDPECLQCHTTGMGAPGGFISRAVTPAMINIQCEACHGAARQHAGYPKKRKAGTAMKICTACHSKDHSPSFNFGRYWPKIAHSRKTGTPIHDQNVSKIFGLYDVLKNDSPIINMQPVTVTEFFNFYCNRCYILNSLWSNVTSEFSKPVNHQQIPVIFGVDQQPWASLAYLAAVKNGKGKQFKDAAFKAKFEHHADISDKKVVINIARGIGIETLVTEVLEGQHPDIHADFKQKTALKKAYGIHVTPTVILNNRLQVKPEHTGNNTNLFVDNLLEIILDMQCRQYGVCK